MTVTSAAQRRPEAETDEDTRYMHATLALGARELGRTWPNPAVGAILVRNGEVIGRGWTRPGGRPHAETIALEEAGDAARGATLYVSLEPCAHHGRTPPCADAIVTAGVGRVVTALEDPNPLVGGRGHQRLREAGIEVVTGVLHRDAEKIHAGHIYRIVKKRPYVTVKIALSADGKAGLAGRRPAPITGAAARDEVHRMRARSDAIAIGVGTAISDDPLLTVRLPGMEDRSPLRVVFDSAARLPLTSQLVQTAREVPVWVLAEEGADHEAERRLAPHGIEVIRSRLSEDGVDVDDALKRLADKGITRLMVEGGPLLAGSFLRAGLVDEAVIFQSPDPLGGDAVEALSGGHAEALRQAGLNLRDTRQAGEDAVFLYERD